MLLEYIWLLLAVTFTIAEAATPDPFQKDVKVEETKARPELRSNATKGILMEAAQSAGAGEAETGAATTPLSMAGESVITFISVFVVGCVITLSVYSWRKFKPESWRMSVPYQYSALNQFDNDPDDEGIDPENRSLNMTVEDSSSDDDQEVVQSKSVSAKTIGAIEPPDANSPATLPVSITETSNAKKIMAKNGRQRSGSNLMEDSDRSSRHSSVEDDAFLATITNQDDLMTR